MLYMLIPIYIILVFFILLLFCNIVYIKYIKENPFWKVRKAFISTLRGRTPEVEMQNLSQNRIRRENYEKIPQEIRDDNY